MPRTLLIDGDIFAYQVAAQSEISIPWDDDGEVWSTHWYPQEAHGILDGQMHWLQEELEADEIVVCLSDPSHNFRKDIFPGYKSNRKGQRKPAPLPFIKDYYRENYNTYERDTLEADDVLGILSTHPRLIPGEKIIVSIDKDLATIPGYLLNLNKARAKMDKGEADNLQDAVDCVSERAADHEHMVQTLAGDATDGYPGCPGVGMDTAYKILDEPRRLVPYEHEVKRGARKGEIEIRYAEGERCTYWEAVTDHYKKAGLGEKLALEQARVARILRYTDYDFKRKKPKLWTPE